MALRDAVLAEVAHDEQMTIWTGEVLGALSIDGHMNPDMQYHDVLDAHAKLAREIRRILADTVDVLVEASKEVPPSEGPTGVSPPVDTGDILA